MQTTTKHRGTARALAAAGATLATSAAVGIATAPTASAATCNAGSACVYQTLSNGSSSLRYQNAGNATISLTTGPYGGWVWNNGVRYPGADHITLTTTYGGYRWRICLHYGPADQNQGTGKTTAAALQPGEVVTGWRWRGECASGEDIWRKY
ncbi:hypothetical protein [Kribbella sp. NPDC050459]|uniref:hypothetical protein n=1 Tax=Kribbella sp. NPDC050459 TaxID=3155785 RepID=UPI00340DC461